MIGYKPILLNTKLPNDVNTSILKTIKSKLYVCSQELSNNKIKAKKVVLPNDDSVIEKAKPLSSFHWANEVALCTTASSLNYKICVYTGSNMFHQLLNAEGIANIEFVTLITYLLIAFIAA